MRLAFPIQTCGPSLLDGVVWELPECPQELKVSGEGVERGRTTEWFRKKTHSTVLSYIPNELGQKKTAKPCPSHKYQ